jgi:hypothetical protein
MKSELIYISNVKVVRLNEMDDYFGGYFPDGKLGKIEKIDKLGKPFNVITDHTFENTLSIHYQPKIIFKEMMNSVGLEKYLRQADINFSWAQPKKQQYLGLIHGNPTNISSSAKVENKNVGFSKSIVPCQFYLIKDELKII